MIAFPEEQMFSLYALVSRIPTVLSNGLVTLTTLIGSRCNQLDNELAAQRVIIEKILAAVVPGPTVSFGFTINVDGQITEGATTVQIKDTQQFGFTLAPVDAKGSPSTIDPTKTTAKTDDPSIASVTLNPDGLSGEVVAGKAGSTQLTVTVTDANNPSDTITGTLAIVVVGGDTATITVNTSAPTDQVPTPPPPPPAP